MDLRGRIETAFATVSPPAPDNLVVPTYDDEGVVLFFRGKSWRELSVEDLRRHEVALSFFSAEAFRYYLPAFMLADLDDPVRADIIGPGILFHFSPPSPYWAPQLRSRLALFSREQKDAIVQFVRTRGPHYEDPAKIEPIIGVIQNGI
jgi:hypothetical protein